MRGFRRRGDRWPRLTAVGAVAGIIAPPLLAAVVALLTIHQRDFLRAVGWDAVERSEAGWPSVLALGDHGWAETAAFAVCGALGMAFAVALADAVPTATAAAGAGMVGLLSLVLAAEALRTDPTWSNQSTWHGEAHDAVYPLVFVGAFGASALLAAGLWRDAGWRAQGRLALATAAVLALSLPVQAADAVGQLGEYLFFGPLLVWLELLAVGLLRRSRE